MSTSHEAGFLRFRLALHFPCRKDTGQLYAKSACRVAHWMAKNGGAAAVTRLVARVANGVPFAEAYAGEQ